MLDRASEIARKQSISNHQIYFSTLEIKEFSSRLGNVRQIVLNLSGR